jgi:hypothetical protein
MQFGKDTMNFQMPVKNQRRKRTNGTPASFLPALFSLSTG